MSPYAYYLFRFQSFLLMEVCARIYYGCECVCVCASHQKLGDTSFNLSLKESILYTDHIDLLQNA